MKNFATLILAVLISIGVSSKGAYNKDGLPLKPSPARLVNIIDTDKPVFTQNQVNQLESSLTQFSNSTSTQIVLVVVNSLNGWEKSQMATEIGHSWGVGQKGKDNGIVILLKPKTRDSRGEVFIAPGYGLEGVIPDAVAKRIVEFEMIPQFKKGDYYTGISNSINVLEGLALKEFSAKEYVQKRGRSKKSGGIWSLLPFILFIIIFSVLRRKGGKTYGSRSNSGLLTALFLASSMGNRGSSWNDFNSGGGGFGGFGGGGFGGGGAGGSW
ncbi:MAG: TPM domain-containing protein [Salibacteraceae bacterium]